MDHFLYAFVEFDSPAEQRARFVYGTSGDPGLYVNGQPTPAVPAGDTLRYGRYLVAEIPLRKGGNIIALKVPKQRFVDMFWVWNVKWHMSTGWETLDPGVMVTSIYRGPILLTYDPRYNAIGFDDLPVLEAAELTPVVASSDIAPIPWVLCNLNTPGGKTVRLCDFASAGDTGTFYRSWLRVHFDGETNNDFTRENPLRSFRP
jgi:hypothetical protein